MIQTSPTVIIPKFRPKTDTAWWDTIERNMRMGWGRKMVLKENEMKDTARLEAMTPRKTVDGLGQLVGIIDQELYLRWHLQEEGCWNDRNFKRKFLMDNPEFKANRPERKYI